MKAIIAYGLIYSTLGQLAVDYVNNCGNNVPECETYFDGCNVCTCDPGDTSSSACTELACLVSETPYCQECEEDSYWLAYTSYQPPGTIGCSLRFIRTAVFQSNNSRCGCPAEYPYYESGYGCINGEGCARLDEGKNPRNSQKFRLRKPNQNPRCGYEFQHCASNSDCPDYLACNIPENPYGSDCTPLNARFDRNCNLDTDCNKCNDDCMGEGIGYCEPPVCETAGCRGELCVPEGLGINTICIAPTCEESCLQYASCEAGVDGYCGWQSSTEYEDCLNDCNQPDTTSAEVECERGGCSNQGCFPKDEPGFTTCDIRCEYSCLNFQTCKDDGTGTCAFITNEGEEDDYQTCLDNCECSGRPLGPCPSSSTTAMVEPTLPPICALVLCESPESRCASATCDGCNADDENIECSVEDCDASPCCGCLTFRINGRNVTGECAGGQIACRCAQPSEDETYCCAGEQFSSICQRDCGTCYDVDEDCTAGPCDECPVNQLSTGDACNFSGTCYWGEESCCGQTFPSYGCSCFNGQAGCFFTDSCLVPPCTTQSP